MAKSMNFLILSLWLVISFHRTLAAQQGYGGQSQGRQQNVCQIESLTAQEPQHKIKAEAGFTEYWDWNDQSFQCAGVAVCRTVIQPKGLLLPQYANAPSLFYVVQGRGVTGVLMSGCPETFQSWQQFSEEREKGQESQRFRDQHQQIRRFQEGDLIALPAGVAHWCYNDGQEDLVVVEMEHTSNSQNQLDNHPRKFLLAGNRQQGQEQQGQHNMFRGLPKEVLSEVFGVDQETARRLQGHDDQRGHIIRIEGNLQMIAPPQSRQQEEEREKEERGLQGNGLEETVCSARFVHDINNPSRADFFSPRAGRINTVNSFKFPILRNVQLSAEHGVLYKNAIKAPHWKQNAHTVIYAVRGEAELQIVDQRGQAVFNDKIREGQLVIVPQNFVRIEQATNQGFEWIAFHTDDNVIFQALSGRISVLRAMPIDVLANAYQTSKEEAQKLKMNREEAILLEPSQRSQRAAA